MLGPDPILDLVRSLKPAADDAAVKAPNLPSQPSIGPQPQHARVAPETYHGIAGLVASMGEQARYHPIKTALSVGAMALPGALEAAPELAALIRGGAEAAPAADAELAARNFYSTLPGLTQRGAAMAPATHARAVESLMSALPKAANAAAPGDDWTALLHPAAADAYAGARPAAESMEIPASLNTGALADSVVAHGAKTVIGQGFYRGPDLAHAYYEDDKALRSAFMDGYSGGNTRGSLLDPAATKSNPYREGTAHWTAWEQGYNEGYNPEHVGSGLPAGIRLSPQGELMVPTHMLRGPGVSQLPPK